MNRIIKFKSAQGGKRLTSLLGLALDGSRLEGCRPAADGRGAPSGETFSVALSLDPLTADPELVGREIRNHLVRLRCAERVVRGGSAAEIWRAHGTRGGAGNCRKQTFESFLSDRGRAGFCV